MYQLIDGKALATTIKQEIKLAVDDFMAKGGKRPHLAAILVGNDGASETYVNFKIKDCEEVGFKSSLIRLPETVSEADLLNHVKQLNEDPDVDGYIVQLPLPKHIDSDKINLAIDFNKDVDGFHPINVGRMAQNLPCYLPATPMGIMEMLKRYNIETSGKNCVVVGRSNIVGTPMSILMSRKSNPGNATVTLAHSRTQNLAEVTREADILIVALGKPQFLGADMVKEGAVVIDVGTTRVPDSTKKSGFSLKGDVIFDEVAPKCSAITPVPGGVGPMTRVSLLLNTLKAGTNEIYD